MSVYQRVQALGEWEIQLKEGTSKAVRDLITPFSHLLVMPTGLYANRLTDAAILSASLYTGVVLRTVGRSLKFGGQGLGWWLGDSDDKGAILESGVTQSAASLSTWVTALRPSSLAAGTVTSPGGSLSQSYQWVTRRQALDSVCSAFGVEWRVNHDFTLDVATAATLYGSTPTAITLPAGGGNDPALAGLEATVAVEQDYFDYASKVYVQGPGGRGSSGGASAYRDGQGNLATFTRVVDSPDCPPGSESTVAGNLLNLWSSTNGQQEISVSASRYGITRLLAPGANLYVYDPEFGLVNTANQVHHQGIMTYPVSVRVLGVRWPVEQGMAVLLRYYSGGSYVYLDLTDYVEFESGAATLEVSWNQRSLGGEFQPASPRTEQYQAGAWATYTPSWTSSGSAPSLGNGTSVGGYRREGTTLHTRGQLNVGSTSTVGTGEIRLSLPSGLTTSSAQYQVLSAFWYDDNTATLNRGIGIAEPSKTYLTFQMADSGPRSATSGLATSDIVSWTGTIELTP